MRSPPRVLRLNLNAVQNCTFKKPYTFGFVIDGQTTYQYILRKVRGIYLLYSRDYFSTTIVDVGFDIFFLKDFIERRFHMVVQFDNNTPENYYQLP